MLPSEYLEKGWTQGAYARDCNGKEVGASNSKAIAWCMYGAILASQRSNAIHLDAKLKLCSQIFKIISCYEDYGYSFQDFNDAPNRTREEVIKVVKQAEHELELTNVT